MQTKNIIYSLLGIILSVTIVITAYLASNPPLQHAPVNLSASYPFNSTATPDQATTYSPQNAQVVLSTTDQVNKLTLQPPVNFNAGTSSLPQSITVNDTKTYQKIAGFGASFTGSSVWELENALTSTQINTVMTNLFDPVNGIGLNLLRQPIGGSDQNAPGEIAPGQDCSYDDNNGQPDDNQLSHFSVGLAEQDHTISVLQQAMQLNPQLKILGTAWCIPQWMLTSINGQSTLNPEYYALYAKYLIKYIQAYQDETPAIPIWALSAQNEPYNGYDFNDNLTATQEAAFIAQSLGPALKQNKLATGIIVYDHNWDHPEYPETILNSPAGQYVLGTAWHKYAGDVSAQDTVHNLFPDKGTFFTEDNPATFSTNWNSYMPEIANRMIDVMRTWSETYIQWTMISNPQHGPGSCDSCGADIYIDNNGGITYTLAYYALGQFSKYILPGATRIDSNDQGSGGLRSVAFKNPDGSIATIIYNDSSSTQAFGVTWQKYNFTYTLPAKAIATFTWSSGGLGNHASQNNALAETAANNCWHRRNSTCLEEARS